MHLIMVETLTLYEDERVTLHWLRQQKWNRNLDLLRTRELQILTGDRDLVSRGYRSEHKVNCEPAGHTKQHETGILYREDHHIFTLDLASRGSFEKKSWDWDLVSRGSQIFTEDVDLVPRGYHSKHKVDREPTGHTKQHEAGILYREDHRIFTSGLVSRGPFIFGEFNFGEFWSTCLWECMYECM